MKSITRVVKSTYMYAIFMACMLLVGCSSPPSVTPLLRVTERALVEESGRLKEDAERDRLYTRQILGSLDDAYRRDLEQAEVLTSGWVLEATTVYVAARDAVIQHEQTLAEERGNRADNLLAAATATRRAILLIEQQDGLLRGVAGEELSQLLYGLTNAGQEYMHE